MTKDVEFIKNIFRLLDSNKIQYCILRNEQEIISGDAHDIDMVVENSNFSNFSKLLTQQAFQCGWKFNLIMQKENNTMWGVHLFSVESGIPLLLHFDVIDTYGWNGYSLISNKKLLEDRKKVGWLYVASDAVQTVTMLFSRLLYHGYIKEKYRDYILRVFTYNDKVVGSVLAEFLNAELKNFVIAKVKSQEWGVIEENVENIRKAICLQLRKKQRSVPIKKIIFKVKRLFRKIGIVVLVNGSATYKKDVSYQIAERLSRSFGGDYTVICLSQGHQIPRMGIYEKISIRTKLCRGTLYITDIDCGIKPNVYISETESLDANQLSIEVLECLSQKYSGGLV